MIFITKIKINKEDPYFSESPFNSCVIKDKYLLIGTKVDKDKKKSNNIENDTKIIEAGIYIINLDAIFNDKSKIDKSIKNIENCKEVNSILHIKDNMFICNFKKIENNYSLTSFEIIEKNEKIDIKKISFLSGFCKNINSKKLINDSFIICSYKKNNEIYKINTKGELYHICCLKLNKKL